MSMIKKKNEVLMGFYAALDVGGSSIKSACVGEDGRIISEKYETPSRSGESADDIFGALAESLSKLPYRQALGVAVGFPGPFDYERGISLMNGIGKFDAIYGERVTDHLAKRLDALPEMRYANDASLYALGEAVFGEGRGYSRVFAVCIGTGIGSGFCSDGKLVTSGEDVPENGWIYNTPCLDGIADEYASAAGIRRAMRALPELDGFPDVKELADAARNGNESARAVFDRFSLILSDILLPYAKRFCADVVVLGGNVSRNADLFASPLAPSLERENIKLAVSKKFADASLSAAPLLFK